MTNESQNDLKDDEVLAQLYKQGAKDTPPAKLNHKIINYAANANKPASAQSQVRSHFSGGWKVPLSMAASVVVVFALLVQLDQNPQQLELPPIPEITIPTEQEPTKQGPAKSKDNALKSQPAPKALYEAEESLADDVSIFKNDANESDMDSQHTDTLIIDKPLRKESQPSTDLIQTKRITKKNKEQKLENPRDRTVLEKSKSTDKSRTQSNEPSTAPSTPASTISKPESTEGYASKPTNPQTAKKQIQEIDDDALDSSSEIAPSGSTQQGSMSEESIESREDSHISSDMAADTKLSDEEEQNENGFSPIPVEDWLLMIEKLVARKDYAEAARQLEKFKQAHPNVNVEDLDAIIP